MKRIRRFVLKIQLWWRMMLIKKKYTTIQRATNRINRCIRGTLVRRKIRRIKHVKELIEVDIIYLFLQ